MLRLSERFPKNRSEQGIENLVWSTTEKDFIIDEGFYLEIYTNSNGVNEKHAFDGGSTWIYIDKDIQVTLLLKLFKEDGNIKDDTLAIHIISNNDDIWH